MIEFLIHMHRMGMLLRRVAARAVGWAEERSPTFLADDLLGFLMSAQPTHYGDRARFRQIRLLPPSHRRQNQILIQHNQHFPGHVAFGDIHQRFDVAAVALQ